MRNKKKILIADDDADIRLGYEVLLTANHYETFFASDALSTVIDAHTHKPDLIILDLGLQPCRGLSTPYPCPSPAAASSLWRG